MPAIANITLLTFPARELSPDEHRLVNDWLKRAIDIAAAYIANRRSDDPALYRRIVVVERPNADPTYLIHQPAGLTMWVKTVIGREGQMETFNTLRAALNSIRRVSDEVADAM
jgi:hypothetical protein